MIHEHPLSSHSSQNAGDRIMHGIQAGGIA